MKKRSIVLAVLLAVMMLFMGASPIIGAKQSKEAQALAPEYQPASPSLYYFHDYCPTITPNRMFATYGGVFNDNITYDRQKNLTAQEFEIMVGSDYFTGFEEGTIVIIDIKTFVPETSLLNALFATLKMQECVTAFITSYSETCFNNSEVSLTNLDYSVFDANYEEVENYLINSFDNLSTVFGTYEVVYVLDGIAVPYEATNGNMNLIFQNYPFLRLFLKELIELLVGNNNYSEEEYDTYEECISKLRDQNDSLESQNKIGLFVHLNGNQYVDLLYNDPDMPNEAIHTYQHYQEILESDEGYVHACVFGFWRYDYVMWQTIVDTKTSMGQNFPIFSYTVDRHIPDPNGIQMFTNEGMDPTYTNDMIDMILLELDNLIPQEE